MDIKGTRTEKNLLASFAGESQARNRYDYFASQAQKDGFAQIARIFTPSASSATCAGETWRSRRPTRPARSCPPRRT